MHFSHHPALRSAYPELAAGALFARGIHPKADVDAALARFEGMARARLEAAGSESELPEIQAWRRAFSRMGLKPTQYRCASESLLRRFKKEGAMPRIHPLIDVCNAISMAFAIPIAVLDVAKIPGDLQVRQATGSERYLSFGGDIEHPEAGEVSFVDSEGNAHARRWTNRQSGLSAVRDETAEVLIVTEAMHAGGVADVAKVVVAITQALEDGWGVQVRSALLTGEQPGFTVS
jgi:DNA/RNA-binding domain of Phe-tRNA-synthetase-like protein